MSAKYRIKYWYWRTQETGEWFRTGLMTKENAEKIKKHLEQFHEEVTVYKDEEV